MRLFQHKAAQGIRFDSQRNGSSIKLKPILVLLFVGFLFYAYSNWQLWLEKLDDRPINAFALVGSPTFTTNEDIRKTIMDMGELKGFFGQDIDLVREQIEKISWVKGAVVRKIWPNRLSIWVTEYIPIAVWNENEFLAQDGTVFKLPTDHVKEYDLPRLSGPDYKGLEVLAAWDRIFKDLKSRGLNLKSVAINERGAWQVVLDNDVTLKLGRGDWKEKLDRFTTIYPQIEVPENKKLSYVDLRYDSGAAVGMVELIK